MPNQNRLDRRIARVQRKKATTRATSPRKEALASSVNTVRQSRGQEPIVFDTTSRRRKALNRKSVKLAIKKNK